MRESEDLMEEAKMVARNAMDKCASKHVTDWAGIKNNLKNSMSDFMYTKTKRKPMVLPVIMEV